MSQQPRHHPRIVALQDYPGACTCGGEHPEPQVTLYSGADACRVLAEDCRALYGERPVMLLSDPETHAEVGHFQQRYLRAEGINLTLYMLASHPVADEATVEEIRARLHDKALLIAVGAGAISDLGKYSASQEQVDFWCMPTAPSMNGYTSSIAAVKIKGVKRTLPATPPQRLYAMPEVIQQAPLKLRQAGFCDVLAKMVSDIDWHCESLLFSHSYCGLPAALMEAVEHTYVDHPEAIGRGDETAVMGLFRGLLLSGVAMSLAGSSAPASGGEHLLSHFWDMREPLTGRHPERHGLQVGLGILVSTACYRRLAALPASGLSANAASTHQATAARIPEIWGQYAAEVSCQFAGKKAALLQFDSLLPRYWPQLQKLFRQVRSPEYFVDLFSRVGAPFSLDAFNLSRDEFWLAALNARAIRERITVLDFAAHAGVLEAAAEDALKLIP